MSADPAPVPIAHSKAAIEDSGYSPYCQLAWIVVVLVRYWTGLQKSEPMTTSGPGVARGAEAAGAASGRARTAKETTPTARTKARDVRFISPSTTLSLLLEGRGIV